MESLFFFFSLFLFSILSNLCCSVLLFSILSNLCFSVAKLCLTLCNPMNCSLPGSSVHGISQAKILEWVAISFSGESSWPRDWTSRVRLSATPSTIQSTEISRPEYWSGQPIPSPGDLPDPGIELGYPALQTDSLPTELSGEAPCIGRQVLYRWATRKAQKSHSFKIFL